MKKQKNLWNNIALRTEIDHIKEKYQEAVFCYTPKKRYLQLTEVRNPHQMYYMGMHYMGSSNPFITSFVLDEGLSIVKQTSAQKEDFQQKLKQKYQESNSLFELSFLTQKYEIPEKTLDPIPYTRYPELNNFQIGRLGFGRAIQTYKIKSDAISRDHCEIVRIQNCGKRVFNYQKTIQKLLNTKTPLDSFCRKLPAMVLENIFEYMRTKDKYVIRDQGSRNGTYIHEVGTKSINLKPNYGYQIDGEFFDIQIKQIVASTDTPKETILQHNARISKMVEEFSKGISWCYYQNARKFLLFPDKNVKDNNTGKFSVLVFRLKAKDPYQYYFIGINENQERRFSIGYHQDIQIDSQQQQNYTVFAEIVFSSGKWKIEAAVETQNLYFQSEKKIDFRKIWVNPPKESPYQFNTKKQYRIKLGNATRFHLQFKNF